MGGGASRIVTLNVVGDHSKATKTLDEAAGKAESSAGRFGKAFGQLGSVLSTVSGGALGPLVEHMEAARGAMEKMGESGGRIGASMAKYGAGVAAVGAGLTMLGDKDKQANQQLKQSIENTGASYEEFAGKIESTIKKQEKYAHSAVETQHALQTLTQATNDPAKALDLMGVAANLAAAKHIGLNEAALKVGKAFNGNTKVLKEFGVILPAAADAVKVLTGAENAQHAATLKLQTIIDSNRIAHENYAASKHHTAAQTDALRLSDERLKAAEAANAEAASKVAQAHEAVASGATKGGAAIDALSDKLKGQADAAANTFTGKLKAIKTEIEDGAAKMGQKYGPAITALGSGMAAGGKIMDLFSKSTKAAAVGEGVLAGAAQVEAVAMGESAAAEGAALLPILLIIAAIAILAIGIYELATHWKTVWNWIKEAVGTAIDFIKNLIGGIVDWIKGHWQLLLAILTGPFGLAVLFIKDHFKEILDFITGMPGRIEKIAEGMWDGIMHAFKGMVNAIIDIWNSLGFDLPSVTVFGQTIGGGHIGVPKIPHLAAGGIVTQQTLAMLGEGGKHEAVIPLDRAGEFGLGKGGGGGGDTVVPITMQVDGRTFARVTARFTRDEWNRMAYNSPTLSIQ